MLIIIVPRVIGLKMLTDEDQGCGSLGHKKSSPLLIAFRQRLCHVGLKYMY